MKHNSIRDKRQLNIQISLTWSKKYKKKFACVRDGESSCVLENKLLIESK